MTKHYATPTAFKAALEQRLRTRSSGDGLELQRTRQLVVYERFLARIVGEFEDDVVLKGGLALELRLERARTTKDVDVRLVGHPEATLDRLQAGGRRDLADHLTYIVIADPRHPQIEAEGMVYEGRRFRVEARLADKIYGRAFGLDVAFGEPMVGEAELLTTEGWLSFAGVPPASVLAYPLETHIAEKLHAYTMPRRRPNSRVKDLPDLALLRTVRDIESEVLRMALKSTWAHRGTHPLPASLPEPPAAWMGPYEEIARSSRLPWATLDQVTSAASALVDPLLAGGKGRWSAGEAQWIET